jgi:hypothetical protein
MILALLLAVALLVTGAPAPAHAGDSLLDTVGEDFHSYVQPRTLLILGVGGAATVLAHQVEDPQEQAEFFSQDGLSTIGDIGNVYGSPVTQFALSGIVYGVGHFQDNEEARETGYQMARALAYTYAAVGVLKVVVDRTRPNGEKYSFPSGHAAGSFATAPILMKHYGWRAGVPAYLLGVAAGIGRMKDSKHYLSDVVFGATLGLSVGVAVSSRDAGATPSGEPATPKLGLITIPRGAGISYRF